MRYLATLFVFLLGCSSVRNGELDHCEIQGNVVSAFGAGVQVFESVVGEDPELSNAVKISKGVASLGEAATRGCRLHRESAGWQQWVGLAFETTLSLIAVFGGASGVIDGDPPGVLIRAMVLLEAELKTPIEVNYEAL